MITRTIEIHAPEIAFKLAGMDSRDQAMFLNFFILKLKEMCGASFAFNTQLIEISKNLSKEAKDAVKILGEMVDHI